MFSFNLFKYLERNIFVNIIESNLIMVKRLNPPKNQNSDAPSNKILKVSVNSSQMFIGAHVSIAKGLENAFLNANKIGAKSFALFLRNQRRWDFKSLPDDAIEKFKSESAKNNISLEHIVPHGSYLLNCGSPKEDILSKSRNLFVEELRTCDKLGIKYFNFHPGSTCGLASREDTIKLIAESINLGISQTDKVIILIENMSCQGHTIGGTFQELQSIISLVENKDRVGICLDTCHAFAAGFPLHTETGYNDMMEKFDEILGLKYLKAIHLNDSKSECGSHLDRHEDIGKGKIGIKCFEQMVNDPRLINIPIILETPGENTYKEQIDLLYKMIKTK